jgi:hypothetical protein
MAQASTASYEEIIEIRDNISEALTHPLQHDMPDRDALADILASFEIRLRELEAEHNRPKSIGLVKSS